MHNLADLAEIRRVKATFAALIARGVPELLPLFLRLEAEEAKAGKNEAALNRALELARTQNAARPVQRAIFDNAPKRPTNPPPSP